jgi:hypothetical protein
MAVLAFSPFGRGMAAGQRKATPRGFFTSDSGRQIAGAERVHLLAKPMRRSMGRPRLYPAGVDDSRLLDGRRPGQGCWSARMLRGLALGDQASAYPVMASASELKLAATNAPMVVRVVSSHAARPLSASEEVSPLEWESTGSASAPCYDTRWGWPCQPDEF